jgi:hypothetical protein
VLSAAGRAKNAGHECCRTIGLTGKSGKVLMGLKHSGTSTENVEAEKSKGASAVKPLRPL